MKILIFLAITLCVHAAVTEEKNKLEVSSSKGKRQTHDEGVSDRLVYKMRRTQEQVAPVEEPQDDEKVGIGRSGAQQYHPGQVFSLDAQELLELQPERKAPLASSQQLQQLYSEPQPEHKQSLQQFYYLEPQGGRQVSLQPSHAVIARPHYTSNGGEASVGAALSVSDTGTNAADTYDQELLSYLSHSSVRQEEPKQQSYHTPAQSISTQNVAPQYQQVDRYITKPSKKPTKLRSKVQIAPPQSPAAPQQYLIETTNIQQQQQQSQQIYRSAPQQQRPSQMLRYVSIQPVQALPQQAYYDRPETQGIKVVAAPKLQQVRPQLGYRFMPQYQQPEATPKQYGIADASRAQPIRQEAQALRAPAAPSVERPVTYLKRFPEQEKTKNVKIYQEQTQEFLPPQPTQIIGEQYYLRPIYRSNEQRGRYELSSPAEQPRVVEPTKPPLSAIYVNKNLAPKKVARPQTILRIDPAVKIEQPVREQAARTDHINIDQYNQNIDDQRPRLPPPKNNKAYTQEEFAALVAAGYSVTPIPVSPASHQVAQSRSSSEPIALQTHRRPLYNRHHQYLPLRGDDAP